MRVTTMRRAIASILCSICLTCSAAETGTTVTHIFERGATMSSIAKKYGVTTQQIIDLNPDAATFIYIGMEIAIPQDPETVTPSAETQPSATPISNTAVRPEPSGSASATYDSETYTAPTAIYQARQYTGDKATPDDHNVFSMSGMVTWSYSLSGEGGDFKTRSAYGIMGEGCSEISPNFGFGLSFGFNANYGLVPEGYGNLSGYFGPTIAVAFGDSRKAGIYLPVCVGIANGINGDDSTYWSCVVLPHFAFSLSRVRINLGCAVNTDFSNTSTALTVGLGYEF